MNLDAQEQSVLNVIQRLTQPIILSPVFFGMTALFGWVFGSPHLKGIVPGLVAMNPLTAIALMIAGFCLLIQVRLEDTNRSKAVTQVLASIVFLIGALKLASFFGLDLKLDQFLFKSSLGDNRMAPNTAFLFTLTGTALITFFSRNRVLFGIGQSAALFAVLFSSLALVGYAYQVNTLYGVASYIPIAVNTAAGFLLLSLGILLSRPTEGLAGLLTRRDAGGEMARKVLPSVIGVPLVLGWFSLVGQKYQLYGSAFGVAVIAISSVVALAFVATFGSESLSRSDLARKRAEELLKAANEELERKVQERIEELRKSEAQVQQLQKMDAVGRLAGGVAHDFNNMLGAITLYCDFVSDDPKNSASVLEKVEEIKLVADRGAALTRQLLVFSRKQLIQRVPTDLNRLVSNLKNMLVRLIGENIEFVTQLSSDLGLVSVDPGQIEQVVMNLVVNARDAMPGGGIVTVETKNVELSEEFTSTHLTVRPGRYVMLSVTDTGHGMDSATRSKLFEPFFTTKPVGKGTGLGLTTTYGIIKQFKGTIWVYSEPGKGTVFKVYLPVAEGASLKEPNSTSQPQIKVDRGYTILLVEDDPKLRQAFTEMLSRRGYHVFCAQDANEALEICRKRDLTLDLLLTDMVMPEMSGFELARQAKGVRPNLRVLYMSGYTNEALEAESQIPDFESTFIQKPFDTKSLVAKVKEVLASEIETP